MAEPGSHLERLPGAAVAWLAARRGQGEALARAMQAAFGLALPDTPRWAAASGRRAVWAGPGQWLIVAAHEPVPGGLAQELAAALTAVLGARAAVSIQSDGRALFRLSGADARETLARLCPIDLHPRAFGPGHAALTRLGQIACCLWQTDDAPTYEIAVPSSYAASAGHAFAAATARLPASRTPP